MSHDMRAILVKKKNRQSIENLHSVYPFSIPNEYCSMHLVYLAHSSLFLRQPVRTDSISALREVLSPSPSPDNP